MTHETAPSPQLLRLAGAVQPGPDAGDFDEPGIGLVECGLPPEVQAAVGQLVEQGGGQPRFRAAQHRIQQRIPEPAERGIGGHRANRHIHALAGQPLGSLLRFHRFEVGAVRHAPGHRETPLPGCQRKLRRCDHVPGDRFAAGGDELEVTVRPRQAELGAGELQDPDCIAEFAYQGRVAVRVGQELGDILSPVPRGRLQVIAGTGAASGQEGR
jgi:hypothetical protein